MNLLDTMAAIEMLDDLKADTPCPVQASLGGRRLPPAGERLLYRTALAWLSGQAESATLGTEIIGAADYGQSLFDLGVVTDEQIQQTARTALAAMMADCERRGQELAPIDRA